MHVIYSGQYMEAVSELGTKGIVDESVHYVKHYELESCTIIIKVMFLAV